MISNNFQIENKCCFKNREKFRFLNLDSMEKSENLKKVEAWGQP